MPLKVRDIPGCRGCPFFGDGNKNFVGDEIINGAPVFVLGQNPGADEEREGRPFIGKTGEQQAKHFFPKAGLIRGENVSIGNAIRCRLNNSNELPPIKSTEMRQAIEHCSRAHLRRPEGARLVIAQGEVALYAATGEGLHENRTIAAWRGWLVPWNPPPRPALVHSEVWVPNPGELAVLPTYHLAYLFRDPTAKTPAQRDWVKVPYVLARRWPEPFPRVERVPPERWPALAAFDTEFVPETRRLIRYSLAYRPEGEPVIHVVEAEHVHSPLVVLARPRIVMHNAPADRPFLPWIIEGDYDYDDTMLEHAVLWSDLPHDLDFGCSIYARTNRWKHLVHTNPEQYSAGDALGTLDFHLALQREFERDPRSRWVYENVELPLVPIIERATGEGMRVDQQRAKAALAQLAVRLQDAQARAQAAVGWPINLGSPPQVSNQLYNIEQIKRRGGVIRRA